MAGFVLSGGMIEVFVGLIRGTPRVTDAGPQTTYTPTFLGVGKMPPEPENTIGYFGVPNDLAGTANPYDKGFAGASAMSAVELSMVNTAALASLEQVFALVGADGSITWDDADLGTLMMSEGWVFPVWYRNRRRSVPAMQASGLADGQRYPGSYLVTSVPRQGNKDNTFYLVFGHMAVRNPATGVWILKDEDMSLVNNLDGA